MCGITGIYSFTREIKDLGIRDDAGIRPLTNRGPDFHSSIEFQRLRLGHCRLSILDPSPLGNQPMQDATGRYSLILNGEIYNFKSLRSAELNDLELKSESDTEVLLHLLIKHGKKALPMLNGFFSIAFYDSASDYLLLARDRIGIKPMVYYHDDEKFIFASELKSLLDYDIPKQLDSTALYAYLQLNYLPEQMTMLKGTAKLEPGHLIELNAEGLSIEKWWHINTEHNYSDSSGTADIASAAQQLKQLLTESVQQRMVSDVPLGSFLSGGVDSSIISALAARETEQLKTFSIGFTDSPFYDETAYAEQVAAHIGSSHSTFKLSNTDLVRALPDVLDYIDEPFADPSAIPVYILSQLTKREVTVALSGDGSDELFAGYNKHKAHFRASENGLLNQLIKLGSPLYSKLPQSRDGWLANKIRQVERYNAGLSLNNKDRYWRWASISTEREVENLLAQGLREKIEKDRYRSIRESLMNDIGRHDEMNGILLTDLKLLLPSDMLKKVDLMSMANSLEVRVPFLDHHVVEYASSLSSSYKITKDSQKHILKLAFSDLLPSEIFTRSKKGFEVPLLDWFKNELSERINDEWLSESYIKEQGIFSPESISALRQQLFSSNPGDAANRVWALIVFQNWYQRYFS